MPLAKETKQTAKLKARQLRLKARQRFLRARLAEKAYSRHLVKVARHVGDIVRGMAPKGLVSDIAQLKQLLGQYSTILRPWAEQVALAMLHDVGRRDYSAWIEHGRDIGLELSKEIKSAPTGAVMRQLVEMQVGLITSIPLKAAERAQELSIRAVGAGLRSETVAKEILQAGNVAAFHARTIARTEVARAASSLTEARARYIGSDQYRWHTAGDPDVRDTHRRNNGKVFRWDDPPINGDDGQRGHPGTIYNCRCWAEPILPDVIL